MKLPARHLAPLVGVLLALLVAAPVGHAAAGTGDAFAPALVPTTLQGTIAGTRFGTRFTTQFAWRAPDRLKTTERNHGQRGLWQDWQQGTQSVGGFGDSRGLRDASAWKRRHTVLPDGAPGMYWLVAGAEAAIARHRAGTSLLVTEQLNGRDTLVSTTIVAGNDCAGLKSGTVKVWLDATTLAPVKVREERPGLVNEHSFTYARVNTPLPAAALRRPRLRRAPSRFDEGFRRSSPAAAAASLKFRPHVPASVPDGFVLRTSGWAPKSAMVGPEASLPRAPGLFAMSWRRGYEQLDLTQRAPNRELRKWWMETDPFAGECGDVAIEDVTLPNGTRAKYGVAPMQLPHLWWKQDDVLFTLTGPFSKDELLRVAGSLKPV